MDTESHITSLQNPQVKNLVKLRGRQHRDALRVQIIEEPLVIRRAYESGCRMQAIYYCLEQLDEAGTELLHDLQGEHAADVAFVRLHPRVMARVSYRTRPAGLLVVAQQHRRSLVDLVIPDEALLVVLDGVEKPGNLGAMVRTADGAGAHGVILCTPGPDPFNPNVLRASRGACFTVPVIEAEKGEIWAYLRQMSIRCIATSPAAETEYTDCDLTGAVAFVLGAEDQGLDENWLQHADKAVRIPMSGRIDSLNVATTAALLLYEAVRQRRVAGGR